MKESLSPSAALAIAAMICLGAGYADAAGSLVVGMTAGDLPITTGNPDQGFEGYRFVGYNLYDSLILWDLSNGDKATDIKPGLATDWHIDEANDKRWIFAQRRQVARWLRFHRGRCGVEFEAARFEVKLDPMDWNALLQLTCAGVDKYPQVNAINVSRQTQDPFNALIRHVWSAQWTPKGSNWGHYGDPAMDKLVEAIFAEFDPGKRLKLLTQLNEKINEEAALIFVAHDLNPGALSPKVHGFIQAQSWFQDLTPVSVEP